MSSSPHRRVGVRLLLVARAAPTLPVPMATTSSWPPDSPWWPWTIATLPGGDWRGLDVSLVDPFPDAGRALRPRALAARTKTMLLARRHGADASWVWALKSSATFRRLVRGSDVLWSLDEATDAALAAVPDLVGERPLLDSRTWATAAPAMAALQDLLAQVVTPEGVDLLGPELSSIPVADIPDAMRVTDVVADVARTDHRLHGLHRSRTNLLALDRPGWPVAPRLTSGLAARAVAAELSRDAPLDGVHDDGGIDDLALARVCDAALVGADQALAQDEPWRALDRLTDAMSLIFHRARHSEVARSPLVEDPAGFLATLCGSRTMTTLLRPPASASAAPAIAPPGAPTAGQVPGTAAADRQQRVLVVTGAYGSFHMGVVAALRGHAEVKIRDFTRAHPHLSRKLLDPDVLPMVAALVAESRGEELGWLDDGVRDELAATTTTLNRMLTWAGVVFCDWADRATVLISHLVRPQTRLIIRIHALDALDPWVHLTRWDRVERVIVVSEPMRTLVTDLLAAMGVQVPVTTMHVLTGLREMARPKGPDARTTLGMIGWGRRVKDPMWALDLLERDPTWRLVLIGPGFPEGPPAPPEAYAARVRERLASPSLRDRVEVVGPTKDVAEPMSRVGVILSTSRREGWHLGLVEGAASGAVPVVRNWPLLASRGGPRLLYPADWVVDDLDEAEARVREVTEPGRWERESAEAAELALSLFDPAQVALDYREVILWGRTPRS